MSNCHAVSSTRGKPRPYGYKAESFLGRRGMSESNLGVAYYWYLASPLSECKSCLFQFE
jgi:hypothetical protein